MITLVTQEKNECVFACLSMVTGVPVRDIKSLLPDWGGQGVDLHTELSLLRQLGWSYVRYVDSDLIQGRVYLLTVPTKSEKRCSHRVVLDYAHFSKDVLLYDPNIGREEDILCYKSLEDLPTWWDVIEIPYKV